MGYLGRVVAGGAAVMTSLVLGLAPASALADTTSTTVATPSPTTSTITLHASRTSFTGSRAIDAARDASTGLPTGGAVNLIKIAYPYKTSQLVRTAHPGADGTFSFSVHPDRNIHYRVIVPGTTAKAAVSISVYARTKFSVTALPLAQARIRSSSFTPAICGGAAPA